MSTSRLEKFIYAICSMEVSDLPAPLSRIEKLWNCLITGETPDFEPQSRNEQYLMAMLDRYDISNLPAPMSRGEKLLYKIAVGETDLSDVPGYLSRYEELLKYLIENGGIGFEYVLYTLNQSLSTLYSTAEKPIKSAILSGQTLVTNFYSSTIEKTAIGSWVEMRTYMSEVKLPIEPSTDYLFVVDVIENSLVGNEVQNTSLRFGETDDAGIEPSAFTSKHAMPLHQTGIYKFILTTKSDLTDITILDRKQISKYCASGKIKFRYMILKYQKDMENWDIPYFEGMQSVKMPVLTTCGKNLFSGFNNYDTFVNGVYYKENLSKTNPLTSNLYLSSGEYTLTSNYKKATSFEQAIGFSVGDEKFAFLPNSSTAPDEGKRSITFTVKNGGYFSFFISTSSSFGLYLSNIQIEKGTTATSYEPYQSNILSTLEDVELCGVGDIKDTLNCNTGEYIKRINSIVLDESGKITLYGGQIGENTLAFRFSNLNINPKWVGVGTKPNLLCTTFPTITYNESLASNFEDKEGICLDTSNGESTNAIVIRVLKSRLISEDVAGIRDFISKTKIDIVSEAESPVVKTVDLTTVDQDGQPTKLKTFNDITYVEIKADNLIPSVDVEVATKINETLATLDPQHLDISNTQNELGQTIDEQSENTDATMMATTEIYEQTL